MKVLIDGNVKEFRTLWMENNELYMIDQTKLPGKFEIYKCATYDDVASAIKNMIIRGASAIGCAGAYAMFLACKKFSSEKNFDKFMDKLRQSKDLITSTRRTAYDLFYTTERMLNVVENYLTECKNISKVVDVARQEAEKISRENIKACMTIGDFGNSLLKHHSKILTHCNAGALAMADYGTALGVIRSAHYTNKKIFVFVDETRPRLQGTLTSWELLNEGIEHCIIVDNAVGYFMKNKEIDAVITGADRIALNGDTANKIGTYEKAILAKENDIPFYVAAPISTIDKCCENGSSIAIEFRSEDEILNFKGIEIFPKESKALNPAFDVTPAKYITAIITEKGISKPNEIKNLNWEC